MFMKYLKLKSLKFNFVIINFYFLHGVGTFSQNNSMY